MKKFFLMLAALVSFALPSMAVDSGCFLTLQVYSSPYQGNPNLIGGPGNGYTCPNCTSDVGVGHTDSACNDKLQYDPPGQLVVSDGDYITIVWPTCMSTGWGVAAQGVLYAVDNGVSSASARITLCIPAWDGSMPYAQVNPPTGPYPVGGNPGVPPYNGLFGPPPIATSPDQQLGFNGCTWRVHITCSCPQHPITCTASFDIVEVSAGGNAAWVFNAGTSFPGVLQAMMGIGQEGLICTQGPYGGPHFTTTNNLGLIYQW